VLQPDAARSDRALVRPKPLPRDGRRRPHRGTVRAPAEGKGVGSQVPRKATPRPTWVGFKATRRCSPSATIVASIARPVVVRSTAPAPSNRLASASIASLAIPRDSMHGSREPLFHAPQASAPARSRRGRLRRQAQSA
jgi:hypothetical protein